MSAKILIITATFCAGNLIYAAFGGDFQAALERSAFQTVLGVYLATQF